MWKLGVITCGLAILITIFSRSSESQLQWVEAPTLTWNETYIIEDILSTHTHALLKDTPLTTDFLDEVKQSMMECDLYNSRHAQFKVIDEANSRYSILGEILYSLWSIHTYLRAGVSFKTYAETFPKYYRDYVYDELKHESAWFWRDAILSGYVSTRVFHGNLERCPSTLDLIKSHVLETMGYQLETNATIFASTKDNIATPAHKHPQNGTLFLIGLHGSRKFAIMKPECLPLSWRMANNTFFFFEPFFSPLPFVFDYSCSLVTGTINAGDILLTDLYYPHHFIGKSEDSTVISFFDKAYHPYEKEIHQKIDVKAFLNIMTHSS